MPSMALPRGNLEREFHLMSGIGYPQKPNRRLIGDYPRLPVRAVPRWATVTVEWPQGVARASLTRASPAGVVISMAGGIEVEVELKQWPMPVVKGRQRGTRTRFLCCRCGASRDALHFVGEWGCRGKDCLNLAFASRHRQRYCTS